MKKANFLNDLGDLIYLKQGCETTFYSLKCTAYDDEFKPEEPTTYVYQINLHYGIVSFEIVKIWDEDDGSDESCYFMLINEIKTKIFTNFKNTLDRDNSFMED